MEVRIVTFPETRVALIEHRGSPALEHDTVRKLVAWKLERQLLDPQRHRSYGLHYTDPRSISPSEHRVDFCLSLDEEVGPNPFGIHEAIIPSARCALARDVGSRLNNQAAAYLYDVWLPQSGYELAGRPSIFHYVNVGPKVRAEEMITDVYLPLG